MATHGKMSAFDPAKEAWTTYMERLQFYFLANGITEEDKMKAVFLTVCGAPTYQLLRGLLQPQTPLNASFDDVKAKLGEHFSPKPSSIVQRYTFHTRLRHQQESVADYVAALRAIGEHCEFGDSLNDMIRDRLVCGINNSRIQTRLLQEQDRLTYELAIKTAQTMELASQNAQDLSKQLSSAPVNQMKHQRERHKPQKDIECYRCGGSHYATHCRFKDVDCCRCGKKGHLAKVCHSSKKEDHNNQPHQNPRSVNKSLFKTPFKYNAHSLDHKPNPHHSATVPEEDSQSTDYPLFTLPGNVQPIVLTMEVNGSDLSMELDTGASLSLISEQTYTNMSHALPPLTQSNVVLSTYTGEKIRPIGTVDVTVRYNSQQVTVPLLVIPGQGPGLVGRNWLEKIKLNWSDLKVVNVFSSIDDIIQKHKEVFCPKLGKLKDIGAKLHVDPQARPRFYRSRTVPHSLRNQVAQELQRLEELEVITPVKYSKWAAPVVPIVKEDGSIRLCGDYKVTINSVLLPDTYPLPRVEDLSAVLSGGKSFSKLDLRHAYLQVPLDEESKKYTTINTQRGLFQYERLPFGISSAPSIFQRIMDNLLKDIPYVCVYLDDILVSGKTDSEHLQNLDLVLKRLELSGLTLKQSKCTFMAPSVQYLGHVIDANGLHPAEAKTKKPQLHQMSLS